MDLIYPDAFLCENICTWGIKHSTFNKKSTYFRSEFVLRKKLIKALLRGTFSVHTVDSKRIAFFQKKNERGYKGTTKVEQNRTMYTIAKSYHWVTVSLTLRHIITVSFYVFSKIRKVTE